MVPVAEALETPVSHVLQVSPAVAAAVQHGLLSSPKTLPPWLFYDERGSDLFEQITVLPEYYLTRTERALLVAHAEAIRVALGGPATVVELGAGSASKTGVLLRMLASAQAGLLYQPIDVSPSALEAARENLEGHVPGLTVRPLVANYITESFAVERQPEHAVLAMYIGSSIGNFTPPEARSILGSLREKLVRGTDYLLLGLDLAPGPAKPVDTLLAAYDDAQGVTAAFNRNLLVRLNRELATDFAPETYRHSARWNVSESRVEMHLESTRAQTVHVPASDVGAAFAIHLDQGEMIHTENSYKFTREHLARLLADSSFALAQEFRDPAELYTLVLARAI